MTSNAIVEEAFNDLMNPMEMMRNLHKRMDEMQHKHEEEMRSLQAEKTTMPKGKVPRTSCLLHQLS